MIAVLTLFYLAFLSWLVGWFWNSPAVARVDPSDLSAGFHSGVAGDEYLEWSCPPGLVLSGPSPQDGDHEDVLQLVRVRLL